MKFVEEENASAHDDGGRSTAGAGGWGGCLGFSLSPQNGVSVAGHSASSSPNTLLSQRQQQHYANPALFFGVGENGGGGFSSSLSVMPLKSDGSLCLVEALSPSRTGSLGIMPGSTPKLEDFLGGARDTPSAIPLGLDTCMYYPQNQHQIFGYPHDLSPSPALFPSPLPDTVGKNGPLNGLCDYTSSSACSQPANGVLEHPRPFVQMGNTGTCSTGYCESVGTRGCADLQNLSLSMSPGSQSSCVTVPRQISPGEMDCVAALEMTKKRSMGKVGCPKQATVHRKSIDSFGQRTSQYRGVTRHRWTGRYEAHLWDNSCKKEGQTRKGRQGGYDMEEKAARAYDLAALKYWGASTHINFPLENYQKELEEMKNMTRQEYVAHLRRKSSGFSRGASMYRGVTRHHQHGRWQARIGRVAGNKDLYLGTFSTQEEAAEAYDIAAIKFRGANAVTNFDIGRYDVERIMASNTLLAGELARRHREIQFAEDVDVATSNFEMSALKPVDANVSDWKMAALPYQSFLHDNNSRPVDERSARSGCSTFRNCSFSMDVQALIAAGTVTDESADMAARIDAHFSNPSSLVTSLSSSREGSPDKAAAAFANKSHFSSSSSSSTSKLLLNGPSSAVAVTSWFPSTMTMATTTTHFRSGPSAGIAMSHLPVFAAWNET
ncbi:hypothetical protein MLD38_012984 [Melastoma candidum]|uniref:Uncharacterized protein n=1 Tax=Melastoma candidum TaxID=119954 RepID=A0ACB9R7Q8_9MYRT|nr:hypothetical protein MLD38_012984 [Melastoma candidum]